MSNTHSSSVGHQLYLPLVPQVRNAPEGAGAVHISQKLPLVTAVLVINRIANLVESVCSRVAETARVLIIGGPSTVNQRGPL